MTPEILQQLYETAILYGFADYKKQRYTALELLAIAKRQNATLTAPILL